MAPVSEDTYAMLDTQDWSRVAVAKTEVTDSLDLKFLDNDWHGLFRPVLSGRWGFIVVGVDKSRYFYISVSKSQSGE